MSDALDNVCVVSRSVLERRQPVRLVAHYSDGKWFISDGETDDRDELATVHAGHLLDDPLQQLQQVRNLPRGREAWRDDPSRDWEYAPAEEQ